MVLGNGTVVTMAALFTEQHEEASIAEQIQGRAHGVQYGPPLALLRVAPILLRYLDLT